MMNWEVTGVLAEIVGATTVVITLIYLSVQIKLAREASQVASSYSTLEIYGAWRSHLIENEQLATLVAKANSGETLSAGEDIQVATLMDDLIIAAALSSVSRSKSDALYGPTAEIEYISRLFKQNPGLAPYLERTRGYLEVVGSEFAEQLNEHLKSTASLSPDSN